MTGSNIRASILEEFWRELSLSVWSQPTSEAATERLKLAARGHPLEEPYNTS